MAGAAWRNQVAPCRVPLVNLLRSRKGRIHVRQDVLGAHVIDELRLVQESCRLLARATQ